MRKRCRRTRTRGKVVLNAYTRLLPYFAYVQDSPRWREWSYRTKSQRQCEQLVAAGEAEAITREVDGQVRLVGYRAMTPTNWERPSPATLTLATMSAVGNDEPATRDRDAPYRLTRRERLEIEKFRVWPLIGDDKAVCVRPRMSDSDRSVAEKLLRRGNRQGAILSGILAAA